MCRQRHLYRQQLVVYGLSWFYRPAAAALCTCICCSDASRNRVSDETSSKSARYPDHAQTRRDAAWRLFEAAGVASRHALAREKTTPSERERIGGGRDARRWELSGTATSSSCCSSVCTAALPSSAGSHFEAGRAANSIICLLIVKGTGVSLLIESRRGTGR